MASIVQRNGRFCVVYLYTNEEGKRKQKWETFKTYEEAKKRQAEVEYHTQIGKLAVPKCVTLEELLREFIASYGKNKWALSTYQANTQLIEHYILPQIGKMKLKDITPRVLERYYQSLPTTKAVRKCTDKKYAKYSRTVAPETIRRVHKLLHSCFNQAARWELVDRNPVTYATPPESEQSTRDIWTAETLFKALELCEDPRLKLVINLAFSCSLRIGELLGLTWDCVEISEKSIQNGEAYVFVNKEIIRVSREALKTLDSKDVIFAFPILTEKSTTQVVLKKPKTMSSVRKVFLPQTVAKMLVKWKIEQNQTKAALGDEYHDYDLVLAGPFGNPIERNVITKAFQELIEKNDLPKVVFHSLRHSSITYKLKLNGGDIKAVQGDSGHAQAKMVTDQYSHILDDDRRANAQLFEDVFYNHKELPTTAKRNGPRASSADAEMIAKLLTDPQTAQLLKALLDKIS